MSSIIVQGQPGLPVSSFGEQGTVTAPLTEPSIENVVRSLVQYPDGRILGAGGTGITNFLSDQFLLRLLPDGELDPGFGNGGIKVNSLSTSSETTWDLLLLPDGRFITVGEADSFAVVARFLENGDVDPSFGTGGVATFNPCSGQDRARAVSRLPDGRLVFIVSDGYEVYLCRILPDGGADATFSGDGIQLVHQSVDYSNNVQMRIDQSDRTYVAYTRIVGSERDAVICRWLANGIADGSFGDQGEVVVDLSPGSDEGWSPVPLSNGHVLFTGQTLTSDGASAFIAELDENGTPVMSFGENGIALLPSMVDTTFYLRSTLVQPDGSILMGGSISHGGIGTRAIVRILPSGQPDGGFGNDGLAICGAPDEGGGITDMELALDGPLLSCGGFLISGLSRGFVMKNYTGLEVGLPESAITQGLSCYPNPTSGALTIAGVPNAKELIVRDALGRVVLRFSMPTDNMTIIIHGLPAGAYLLELVSPGQLLGRTSFVRE